ALRAHARALVAPAGGKPGSRACACGQEACPHLAALPRRLRACVCAQLDLDPPGARGEVLEPGAKPPALDPRVHVPLAVPQDSARTTSEIPLASSINAITRMSIGREMRRNACPAAHSPARPAGTTASA